eukprot:scaffold2184_cov160-Skeletonema_dohrnii-CCMP3373.AAC.1
MASAPWKRTPVATAGQHGEHYLPTSLQLGPLSPQLLQSFAPTCDVVRPHVAVPVPTWTAGGAAEAAEAVLRREVLALAWSVEYPTLARFVLGEQDRSYERPHVQHLLPASAPHHEQSGGTVPQGGESLGAILYQ